MSELPFSILSNPPGILMPKLLRCILLSTLVFTAGSGCSTHGTAETDSTKVIRIEGSDTMLRLVERWAEEYMKLHPDVAVYTKGGGSGTGIKALIEGETDLCSASRTLRPSEVKILLQKQGTLGLSILTARDALSVYLHPSNPVSNLSLLQLREIFSGRLPNWKELGGRDLPVKVVSRPPNSGTFFFFKEHVLEGDSYSSRAETVPTTAAVIRRVLAEPGAIGYGGLAYGGDVIHCAIEGVPPTAEHVRSGNYPIARYLYFFAARQPEGTIKEFIDWVLSDEGQRVVRDVGYIPLWEMRK